MRRARGGRLAALTIAVLSLVATPTEGAPADDASPSTDTTALARRIGDLTDELARAEADLASARVEWTAEEAALERRLEELSSQLLDRALANERGRAELAEIGTRHRALDADGLESSLDAALAVSRALAEQLSILAGETPGLEAARTRLATALESLSDGHVVDRRAASTSPAATLDESLESALLVVGELVDQLHAGATGVALLETVGLTARDVEEPMELLAAGGVSFAYRTREDHRIGWAIASPADATGYRWTEELDAETRSTLESAFESLARGDPAVPVVVDASGTLRGDALTSRRNLVSTIRDGGPVMIPIALVALLALLIVIERLWALTRESGPGDARLARAIDDCRERRVTQARETLAKERGCAARVLVAGLAAHERGPRAVEESLQASLLVELPRLDRRLAFLSMLGGVAPLLGLLGTVTGIIQTFTSIKVFRSTDPTLLAGGISEALVTTAAGLIVAIPTVIAHGYLSGRVDRIAADSEKHAALLLGEIAQSAGGPAPDANETSDAAPSSEERD